MCDDDAAGIALKIQIHFENILKYTRQIIKFLFFRPGFDSLGYIRLYKFQH